MSFIEAQRAFVERLDRHRGILQKVSTAYCRDAASRGDLRQEIVVQLWRSYGRFDEGGRFSTWMYGIALNTAISFARSRNRKDARVALAEPAILERIPDSTGEPQDERIQCSAARAEDLRWPRACDEGAARRSACDAARGPAV
ncbi:MAG: RNA polymerase sigma factor [Candidatus Cybelea sp.]